MNTYSTQHHPATVPQLSRDSYRCNHHLFPPPSSVSPVHRLIEEPFNDTARADDMASQATRLAACQQVDAVEPTIRKQLQDIGCVHGFESSALFRLLGRTSGWYGRVQGQSTTPLLAFRRRGEQSLTKEPVANAHGSVWLANVHAN